MESHCVHVERLTATEGTVQPWWWREYCCRCGDKRTANMKRVRVEGHGRFLQWQDSYVEVRVDRWTDFCNALAPVRLIDGVVGPNITSSSATELSLPSVQMAGVDNGPY